MYQPNWFFFAILAPILWSFINHIDKYLLNKFPSGKGVNAIILFSTFFSALILPFIAIFFHQQIFSVSLSQFFLLIVTGFFGAAAFYFYLKAMDIEEASIVVALLQLTPVFAYFLSFFILNETLQSQQILYSLIILLGIIVISFEIDIENKFKIKTTSLLFAVLSSFLFALNDVCFKLATVPDNFWISTFWQYFGIFIFGSIFFISSKKSRDEFKNIVKNGSHKVLYLNVISESFYTLGNLANSFATLLAPVAIVSVVSSYQPLFVFLEGIMLTKFLPKLFNEKISYKHLLHKFISVGIIIIGTYLLYLSN